VSDREELRKRRERVEAATMGGFDDASSVLGELGPAASTYAPTLPEGAARWTLEVLQHGSPDGGALLAVYALVGAVFHDAPIFGRLSANQLDVLVNGYLRHWNDHPVQPPRLDQDSRPLPWKELARDILANRSYRARQPVLLVVGQVGRNAEYLQHLADELAAPVYAYTANVPDARGSIDPNLTLYTPRLGSP
jgi:hypothetical protein